MSVGAMPQEAPALIAPSGINAPPQHIILRAFTNEDIEMKPKNFPARKLARQLAAKERSSAGMIVNFPTEEQEKQLERARAVRTKKHR